MAAASRRIAVGLLLHACVSSARQDAADISIHMDETPRAFDMSSSAIFNPHNLPVIFLGDATVPIAPQAGALPSLKSSPSPLPVVNLIAIQRAQFAAEVASGLNLTALLFEFTDMERALLDRLTQLEASPDRTPSALAQLNSTQVQLQSVGEVVTIVRYLLQEEDTLVTARIQLTRRRERLAKLQMTLSLLRKDNEVRAAEYLDYLSAAVVASGKAVRAYTSVKEELDADFAAWERSEGAAHSGQLQRLATSVESAGHMIARQRDALQEDYRVAGAAKRILDTPSAPVINPELGLVDSVALDLPAHARKAALEKLRAGWTLQRARDFEVVSAHSSDIQQAREELAQARQQLTEVNAALQRARTEQGRMGMETDVNGTSRVGGGSALGGSADSLLGSSLRSQTSQLMDAVRTMLQLHKESQLDARSRTQLADNTSTTGSLGGAGASDGASAWSLSPQGLASELASVEAQHTRLAAARKILEDELARRAGRLRHSPGASTGGGGTGVDFTSLPAGSAMLLAAVRAGGGVGTSPGASAADLVYSTAIQRLLAAAGLQTGSGTSGSPSAGALNLGTGGVHGLGGCEYCAAQRQISRLADEVYRLRSELAACTAKPAQYAPDCAPRLQFQVDKLSAEVRRRQAMLAAEDVELQRVEESLSSALQACAHSTAADAAAVSTGSGNDNGTTAAVGCKDADVRAATYQRRLIVGELETRRRITAQAVVRTLYACLWQYRNNSVSEVVAKVMTEGDTRADAAFSSALAFLEVTSRQTSLSASESSHSQADTAYGPPAPPATAHPPATAPNKMQQLLDVCVSLGDPMFASGAPLRSCLCTESQAIEALRRQAQLDAQLRAASAANASKAALEAAAQVDETKRAAEAATLAAAKDKLFQELKSRPEFAKLVADALAGSTTRS